MDLVVGDHHTTDFASMDKLCGSLVQYSGVAEALHKSGAHLMVAPDPLALVALKPPSEFWGWHRRWFHAALWCPEVVWGPLGCVRSRQLEASLQDAREARR